MNLKSSAGVLACLALALGTPPTAVAAGRPDLTGRVVEADGTPIAKASVFIYTAAPKEGTSGLCPYCYPDCQKKARTDGSGQFQIPALDSTLVFRLLVVAANHESRFVSKVDPAGGAQKIALQPLSAESLRSSLRIKGMVINEQGQPVGQAVVSPEGVAMGEMTRWGGNDQVVEPLAVADDDGHFVLFCKSNSVSAVYATAAGRGVAPQWVTLKPGGDYLVKLPAGVALTGQVLRQGEPLKGVEIGAVTKDRTCGVYFNCDAVATDAQGRFLLPNIPPDREFVLYNTMKSLHGDGTVSAVDLTTGASGTRQDVGKLAVQPAYSVAGRIVLSDGKPVPPNTRLFLGRSEAMDSLETELDADGHFAFKGVPAESVCLSVRIKGYRLSKRNPSLDWLNGDILGRVSKDVDGLAILLEPGNWGRTQEDERPGGDDDYPVNKPLRGLKL